MSENTLTKNGRTLEVGQRVQTPMGKGYIIAFDPGAQMDYEVQVKLDTPKDFGSKFWFAFEEIQVLP
jgi:hypothetical protein